MVPFRISRQVEQIPYLPSPLEDVSEYEKFQPIAYGWQIKSDWPREYKHDFKMRVSLRPHESGNPNHLLRGDGKYIGVQPQQFLDYLLNPENLPGLLKYCRVKAPCMKARDHVWKYTIDKRVDGSIFVTIRVRVEQLC